MYIPNTLTTKAIVGMTHFPILENFIGNKKNSANSNSSARPANK